MFISFVNIPGEMFINFFCKITGHILVMVIYILGINCSRQFSSILRVLNLWRPHGVSVLSGGRRGGVRGDSRRPWGPPPEGAGDQATGMGSRGEGNQRLKGKSYKRPLVVSTRVLIARSISRMRFLARVLQYLFDWLAI